MILKHKNNKSFQMEYLCIRPFITGEKSWFVRISDDKTIGQSYGKTKFEAFRNAILNTKNWI